MENATAISIRSFQPDSVLPPGKTRARSARLADNSNSHPSSRQQRGYRLCGIVAAKAVWPGATKQTEIRAAGTGACRAHSGHAVTGRNERTRQRCRIARQSESGIVPALIGTVKMEPAASRSDQKAPLIAVQYQRLGIAQSQQAGMQASGSLITITQKAQQAHPFIEDGHAAALRHDVFKVPQASQTAAAGCQIELSHRPRESAPCR